MGIIIRQSLQNTLVSYLGVALGFVTTIWLYPNILSPEQYGLTRVMLSLSMIMTQFMSLGINNTIVRFFPYFRDEKKNHHGFLLLSLLVPAAGYIVFGSVAIIFQDSIIQYFIDRSALLVDYYWYLLPLAFFLLFFHVMNNFLRALYDTVMGSFLIQVLTRLLAILLLVSLTFGWIDFRTFMVLFVASYGVAWLTIIVYTLTQKNVSLKPDFSFVDSKLARKLMSFGFFAFWGEVASIAVSNIDIIMLSWLAGLEQTGIYAIAFYIGSAITIIRQSVYKISSPIISDAFKKENYALIEDIYKRSSLNLMIGGGLIFCGIVANLGNLMSYLPAEYESGSMVILVLAVANLFDMATGLNGAIIINSKLYRFDLYSTFFLISLTILLNYLLIPVYGILGAALGTATAILLHNTIKVVYVWIRFKMQPFNYKLPVIIALGTLVLYLNSKLPLIVNVHVDLVLRSLLITAAYVGPLFLLKISEDLNNLIETTLVRTVNLFTIKNK